MLNTKGIQQTQINPNLSSTVYKGLHRKSIWACRLRFFWSIMASVTSLTVTQSLIKLSSSREHLSKTFLWNHYLTWNYTK